MRGRSISVTAATSAAWLVVAGGCDSDDGPIALGDIAAEVHSFNCARAVACGAAPDQATCAAASAADGEIPTLVAAVARGTAAYDGKLARECLHARYWTECLAIGDPPGACADTFTGKVAPGGACVSSEECAGGGNCVFTGRCAGTCAAPPTRVPIGGACTVGGNACADGAYCAPPGTCTARASAGAPCDAANACLPPSYCNTLTGVGPATCVVPPGPGETCRLGDALPCRRTDHHCDPVTLKCTKDKPPGTACTESSNDCVDYAGCVDGTCRMPPTAGQACDSATNPVCFDDLECTDNVCRLPPPETACTPPGS